MNDSRVGAMPMPISEGEGVPEGGSSHGKGSVINGSSVGAISGN